MSTKTLPLGARPSIGTIPDQMAAQIIRADRYGEPQQAIRREHVEVPPLRERDVLVYVMAAGINFNNVWASSGAPLDVIQLHQRSDTPADFHIGGSDASGVVFAVGSEVRNVSVGDEVILHGGCWDPDDPFIVQGGDPLFSKTTKMWGYEVNWGGFAQFCRVQEHQCLPKASHLTWEEAAAFLVGGATAYRMLKGWPPHTVQPGDPVLIWGGAGGLGSMAIQMTREMGGRAIAVVSSEEKAEYCKKLGAVGCINRKDFDHWGAMPHCDDEKAYAQWHRGVRAFGKAIWDVLGEKRNPRIVFEHSGEDTFSTSMYICDTAGMIVTCGGTSGYYAAADLRHMWIRQKRFQGSHYANTEQAAACNQMVAERKIDPCLSRVFTFDAIPEAHQLMLENRHPVGNMVALVGAHQEGLTSYTPEHSE